MFRFRYTLNPKFRYISTLKMSTSCKIAVCQFTATNNKGNNLQIVKRLVTEAASKEAKVVFLPEGCDYIGSNKEETKALAEPLTGTLMNEYRNLAKLHNVWLSIGGFHELTNLQDKFFNTHVLIDATGAIQATYKKLHLFDVTIPEENIALKESDATQGGAAITPPVNTPAGPMSLSICYDLRFPELSILQRQQGASILTYPSAFTHATGLLHWEILLRARAIETQCYVIAAAQYGRHNDKRVSFGQALVVDPWGKIVAECPKYREGHETNECVAVATIDLGAVAAVRRSMPVFEHRRGDIYSLKMLGGFQSVLDDRNLLFSDKVIPGGTVFCKTRFSFAFTNLRCVVPGHVLVSSLRVAKRLEDLKEEEVSDLFQTAVRVQSVVEKVYGSDSSTVVCQDGKQAGQTVPHVHIHILPRKAGDFANNDDIYDSLSKHDRDSNPNPMRSIEEMSEEAAKLREFFV